MVKKMNVKAIFMGVLLLVSLITINADGSAFTFPAHCDRTGYPSCYSIGFDAGKTSPGSICPSGHSTVFCNGWDAGANTGSNDGIQNAQQNSPPSSNTSSNQSTTAFVFIVLFLLIVGIFAFRIRNRVKSKERKGFPQYVKENIIRKQDHKCAHCKKLLNVVDWDHKNGDRSDNRENNCQALCPNCHAIKTRRGQSKR